MTRFIHAVAEPQESQLLKTLDALFRCESIRSRIDAIVERVAHNLAGNREASMAWESIPLELYGDALPDVIRSSWVFILRAGRATGAERHPNSVQRMVSYRGAGDLQTSDDMHMWTSYAMVSDRDVSFEQRWLSIPINTWHQAVVTANEDWVVVSFHSVAADELIEERPDPEAEERMWQRKYVDEARQSW